MFRKSWNFAIALVLIGAGTLFAGTFGKVVSIGGAASDVALDEARGVLYVSNFTANRIEVMSLATNTIQTSINVASQPSALALSPDGHWLVVTHYGNNTTPASSQNALTVIDLNASNARQTFALGSPPLGVAFGIDNKALIVTTTEFILFDPQVGSTRTLITIAAAAKQALPAPAANFPSSITGAAMAASADHTVIYGLGDNLQFRFVAGENAPLAYLYTSSPPQAPRTVSVAADGSFAATGWTVSDFYLNDVAEYPNAGGLLSLGGHTVDSRRGVIYSQVVLKQGDAPVLNIHDMDNLTIRESLLLPENMAGKSAITEDGSVIYAVSDSGVLILPVGTLNKAPRLVASATDLLFLGNFCDRNLATKTFLLTNPGGAAIPFSISSSSKGVTVSPSTGVTPATITVRVDPNVYANQKGTSVVALNISSPAAVNFPPSIRVLINSKEPEQRGTAVSISGTLVDLLADPVRNRYYVLRQDKNSVMVFDGANNLQTATLRSCTKPMGMAITMDARTLLVGCDNAQIISVFDLDTLQALPPIPTVSAYVQSIAASNKAVLAVVRDGGGGNPYIAKIDLVTRTTSKLATLGVYENKVVINTVLTTSPNGSKILIASSDGNLMLYDAVVDSFTASRKDSAALSGAYAASSFDRFVVGSTMYNSSLVPVAQFETTTGLPSGFIFVDDSAVRTSAPTSSAPGVVQRVNLSSGGGIRPTRMVEAPLLSQITTAATDGCTTSATGNTTTVTCVSGGTATTQVCTTTSGAGGTSTTTCSSSTSPATNISSGRFTRSLAMLQNRTALLNLTTSGLTVLAPNYDAAVVAPTVNSVVSAADSRSAAAPGGLISLYGTQLAPTNLATKEIPLPTALADSCLTVNGQPMPLIFVSPNQINAQMPFQAQGNVTIVVHTPGGTSDNFNLTVPSNSPAVFRSGVSGPVIDMPTVVRASNNLLATPSNPVHRDDVLVIYLTGMGQVTPVVLDGMPSPSAPLASALAIPVVTLGGVTLPLAYAGLAPGQVGVYQINATVPRSVPQGGAVQLIISQGGLTNTFNVRVVE